MSLLFTYSDPRGISEPAVSTSLSSNTVRFGKVGLGEAAEVGEPAVSGLEIDDPDAVWNFVGLRAIQLQETSAPSNNSIVWRGAVADRRVFRADSMRTGAARRWSLDLVDYNHHLAKRILVDADSKRPEETAGDRLRWLLNRADHIDLNDYGYVSYPSDSMDAVDYRGQTALDVLSDCAVESGYNFWCVFNEAHQRPELFFMSPGATTYTSTLAISNDLSDVDSTVTFAPYEDAELTRSASRVAFGVFLPYERGYVYVRNTTTGQQFDKIDRAAPMANVKRETRARRIANHFLADHDEEDDRIACAIKVPAASVNGVRVGQRVLARFTHLPGYEQFSYLRVLRRTVYQDEEGGDGYYRIALELSPTGDAPVACSTALSATVTVADENHDGAGSDSASITPTDGQDSAIIIGFIARNQFTPDAKDAHLTAPATEVYAANQIDPPGGEHPTWANGYQHVAAASGATTISATYTVGGGDNNGSAFVLAAIRTSATAPVQSKFNKFPTSSAGTVTLDSAVTAGNMIAMIVTVRDGAAYPTSDLYPATGWSELKTADAKHEGSIGSFDGIGLYARCVQAGDGDEYGVSANGSKSHSVTVMEWAIS